MEVTENESDEIYTVGTLLTFACASGLQILPEEENKLVCSEAGSWEGQVGKCYTGEDCIMITIFHHLINV